jgi:diketogulonate reductase-like aldo/keto reductase
MTADLRRVNLPRGESVPVLGQGTWHMGENPRLRDREIAALRLGIDLGLTLIDTAEMYADGGAEEVIAQAIRGRRDEVLLVSKVLPHHATRRGTVAACEQSLKRLDTDHLDMYLLHWPGSVPLHETLDAFRTLQHRGLIRHWGVSNFDLPDMDDVLASAGGDQACTNQVLYNLGYRGIEFDLLPWSQQRGVPIMAYSPIMQGDVSQRALEAVAQRSSATPAQVALAWVLRQDGVIAIPKASTTEHVMQNRAAVDLRLSAEDLAVLDESFPPPTKKRPLEML